MKYIKTLKIDIDKKNFEVIPSVQYDSNTRFLHIQLLNDSVPFDITGCSVVLSGVKEDGNPIFNSCNIVNSEIGFIQAEVTEQMNAIPGYIDCEIKIYDGKGVLTSKKFTIKITASQTSRAVESTGEFKALTDALSKVNNINNKMDRGEKISVSQIDKNQGKIDETYLSEKLLQQMAGNTPIGSVPNDNSITSEKLTSKSVSVDKTKFFGLINQNLLDGIECVPNKYINETNGTEMATSIYKSTPFIEVQIGEKYYCNRNFNMAYYDENMVFVSGKGGASWNYYLTIPEGVKYARLTFRNEDIPHLIHVQGIHEVYETKVTDDNILAMIKRISMAAENDIKIKPIKKIQLKQIEGFYDSNDNIIDVGSLILDGYFDRGIWKVSKDYNSSPYIETDELVDYYCSDPNVVCFYDKNFLPIKQLWGKDEWGGNTFTTPNGCKYFTLNFRKTNTQPRLFKGIDDLGNGILKVNPDVANAIGVEFINSKFTIPNEYSQTQTKNLINIENFLQHCVVNDDTGLIYDYTDKPESGFYGYGVTELIEVKTGVMYSIRGSIGHIAEYDKYGRCVKFSTGNTIKFPCRFEEPTKYIRMNTLLTAVNNAMFGVGNMGTFPNYIPYVPQKITIDSIEPFELVQSTNLYNPLDDEKENTAINVDTGKVFTIDTYQASGWYEVNEGEKYSISQHHNMAYYDENKNFVEGKLGGSWTNPIIIPEGIKYFRCTWRMASGYTQRQINKSESLLTYEDPKSKRLGFQDKEMGEAIARALSPYLNIGGSKLTGLIWNVLGDSITSSDYAHPNWWEIIRDKYGMTVNGYGISGTTLSHTDDRHLWDYNWGKLDPVAIGYDKNNPSTWITGNCFCERYTKMDDNADIITVMGSTNDGAVTLGEWNSTDTSTLYGALNVLINGLIEKYPDKIIAFFTPIQSANCYKSNLANPSVELDKKSSTSTLSIQLRAEAIKRKCAQYAIPCLDLFNMSGINGIDGRKELLYRPNDTLHPSVEGNAWMAKAIENFLLTIL